MSVEQIQARVTARVWQAIAQNGIELSGVDKEKLNKLVDVAVDAALEEVDGQLAQQQKAQRAQTVDTEAFVPGDEDEEKEVLLWEGRPFLSLTVNYIITNERVRVIEGLIGKDYEDVELVRVQDVDFKQSVTERLMSLGDIIINSHDPSHPKLVLQNIQNPKDVHELLRRAVIKARKKNRLTYREEM